MSNYQHRPSSGNDTDFPESEPEAEANTNAEVLPSSGEDEAELAGSSKGNSLYSLRERPAPNIAALLQLAQSSATEEDEVEIKSSNSSIPECGHPVRVVTAHSKRLNNAEQRIRRVLHRMAELKDITDRRENEFCFLCYDVARNEEETQKLIDHCEQTYKVRKSMQKTLNRVKVTLMNVKGEISSGDLIDTEREILATIEKDTGLSDDRDLRRAEKLMKLRIGVLNEAKTLLCQSLESSKSLKSFSQELASDKMLLHEKFQLGRNLGLLSDEEVEKLSTLMEKNSSPSTPATLEEQPCLAKDTPGVSRNSISVPHLSTDTSSNTTTVLYNIRTPLASKSSTLAVIKKTPSCSNKTPAYSKKTPSCSNKTPACSKKTPSCSNKTPACSKTTPSCSNETPACSKKTTIPAMNTPIHSCSKRTITHSEYASTTGYKNASTTSSKKATRSFSNIARVSLSSPSVSSNNSRAIKYIPRVGNSIQQKSNNNPEVSSKDSSIWLKPPKPPTNLSTAQNFEENQNILVINNARVVVQRSGNDQQQVTIIVTTNSGEAENSSSRSALDFTGFGNAAPQSITEFVCKPESYENHGVISKFELGVSTTNVLLQPEPVASLVETDRPVNNKPVLKEPSKSQLEHKNPFKIRLSSSSNNNSPDNRFPNLKPSPPAKSRFQQQKRVPVLPQNGEMKPRVSASSSSAAAARRSVYNARMRDRSPSLEPASRYNRPRARH